MTRDILTITAVLLLTSTLARGSECDDGRFPCHPGYCAPDSWLCDGWDDCSLTDDEANCEQSNGSECAFGRFPCEPGYCAPNSWLCNGWDDCSVIDDEADCGGPSCDDGEFECNSECKSDSLKCDGIRQCWNTDDERGCPTTTPSPEDMQCMDTQFYCMGVGCVLNWWRCDGSNDCTDGADERDCDVVTTLATTTAAAVEILSCEEGRFFCRPTYCAPNSFKCNGLRDCTQVDDEADCTTSGTTPCPGGDCDNIVGLGDFFSGLGDLNGSLSNIQQQMNGSEPDLGSALAFLFNFLGALSNITAA